MAVLDPVVGLGKTVATIFDRQDPGAAVAIQLACDRAFEQPYAGFEHLLRAEIAADMQRWFVQWFVGQGEWPQALMNQLPPEGSPDAAYSAPFLALFTHKKGDEYLTIFFNQCAVGHFPATMMRVLADLRAMVEPPPPPPPIPVPPIPVPPVPQQPEG